MSEEKTELKTMADFEDVGFAPLRNEAIKHLEKLEEERKHTVEICGHYEEEASVIGVMDWIKNFFGITEADLK